MDLTRRSAQALEAAMTTDRTPATEADESPWMETARMYARNADYWRDRALRAERFYPVAWWRAIQRFMRNRLAR